MLSERILLRKDDAPIYSLCAADSRYKHRAVCLVWSIATAESQGMPQSTWSDSKSDKTFSVGELAGVAQIAVVLAILADNARIVSSGLFELDVGADLFGNGCRVFP